MKNVDFTSKEAVEILNQGYVLAFPTETVYGVGVRWDSLEAYDRLCHCKNRRPDKPIAVMCAPEFDLSRYFEISQGAQRVMKKFLPGPLTCLVKAKENAPYQSHLGTFVAGIRIPDKKELLFLLSQLGYPLQVTSANISGQPSTVQYEEVLATFQDSPEVKGIVKGTCVSGTPTTVVNLTGEKPIVVRQGEITLAQIEEVFYQREEK